VFALRSTLDLYVYVFVHGSKHDRRHVVTIDLQLFVRAHQEMQVARYIS
jgi:hypothetical protein